MPPQLQIDAAGSANKNVRGLLLRTQG